jgi:hypothetical protein
MAQEHHPETDTVGKNDPEHTCDEPTLSHGRTADSLHCHIAP